MTDGAATRFEIGACTDAGLVRRTNEDSSGFDEGLRLMAVADGMGGHQAGEVASGMAVKAILSRAKQLPAWSEDKAPRGGPSARARHLGALIRAANAEIYKRSLEDPRCSGMGTTVVALWAGERAFSVAHVGDSRAYLFRGERLMRLTRDHSWARERVDAGLMAEDEACAVGLDSILTRALGSAPEVEAEISEHELRRGDVIILASDGLTKMVKDEAISSLLAAAPASAARLAQELVRAANAAGGRDNITVVAALAE